VGRPRPRLSRPHRPTTTPCQPCHRFRIPCQPSPVLPCQPWHPPLCLPWRHPLHLPWRRAPPSPVLSSMCSRPNIDPPLSPGFLDDRCPPCWWCGYHQRPIPPSMSSINSSRKPPNSISTARAGRIFSPKFAMLVATFTPRWVPSPIHQPLAKSFLSWRIPSGI
jgi:hypothetical protein